MLAVVFLILALSLLVSALVAIVIVRSSRGRAQERLTEVPGEVRRSIAATSMGMSTLGPGQLRGTGTLVLTDGEVAFAQWRPDRLVRIPRAAIIEVDTTRTHLGKTMKQDLLRIRWNDETAGEDTIALFVRELDPWLADLGGTRRTDEPPDAPA
jgi:hypothetical protein